MSSRRTAFSVFLVLVAVVLGLDQATKWLALEYLQAYQPRPVTDFLNLTLVFNRGAAFGFLNDQQGWQVVVFAGIALLVVVYVVTHLYQEAHRIAINVISYGLITGGAIGNLIDRVRFGHVVDFVDFHLGGWHFWVFNVADSALTIGVALLVLAAIRQSREQKRGHDVELKSND